MILLAGPSGAGKSRLAERLGLPVVRLDDFYRSHDDPALPRFDSGLVDWDDPASWCHDDALAALERLCSTGHVDVPTYDIAASARTGWHALDLDGAALVVAEGIFAHELTADLTARGLLADAVCVTQSPVVTFARRFTRDLAEGRKSPWILLTRGLRLMREQPAVVRRALAHGCRRATPDEAYASLRLLPH